MAMTMSSQFSRPSQSGDAVSVIVLVEDSRAMAGKWTDVRNYYLPKLLESLRAADATVPMRVSWLTSSPSFTPLTTTVSDVSQCRDVPEMNIGYQSDSAISTSTIRRTMNIFTGSNRQIHGHQHIIGVAVSPLLGGGDGPSPMQSGIDPWIGIALALCQENLRLHLILGPASETKAFHELFDRARYVQSLSAIRPWFQVDTTRYSVLLAGSPSTQSSQFEVTSALPRSNFRNVSPESADETSSSTSVSQPPSPIYQSRLVSARRSSLSATSSFHADSSEGGRSRSAHDSLGLVSYLQRMHGLTKKRSYGVKAAKRPVPGDPRVSTATRPILPRLDLPISPLATPALVPSASSTDISVSSIDSQSSSNSTSSRSSTSPVDRRTRSRGPWLSRAAPPLTGGGGSSTPDSTTAALLSLQSMTPRLTEFHTVDSPSRSPTTEWGISDRPSGRGVQLMHALAYHNAQSAAPDWYQNQPSYKSNGGPLTGHPTHPSSASASNGSYEYEATSFPHGLFMQQRECVLYDNTPVSSQTTTPLPSPTITVPASPADSTEDQPFVITPEYEAFVAAEFEHALRSGAMQASMTSSLTAVSPSSQPTRNGHSPPSDQAAAYLPQLIFQSASNYQRIGYMSPQYNELPSQYRSSASERDNGQSYLHETSQYDVSPTDRWYA